MQKCITCILIMLVAFLTLSACGNPENQDMQELVTGTAEISDTGTAEEGISESEHKPSDTTEIKLTFGNEIVFAAMDNSETTQAFLELLPLTLSMNRYGDREYYAPISELPENGEDIPDFENGDITYFMSGKSLAIFFGNEGNSSQGGLICMGKIASDLSVFETMEDNVSVTVEIADRQEGEVMQEYDFSVFENVELIGVDLSAMSGEQIEVLYQQARYCQAMTDADIVTMRELVPEDMTFTHMSGRQQTREEYFADVENGSLRYFTIGIDSPVVEVDGYTASVTYTSVLNANAYGARGTYRMTGTHWFEKWQDKWFLSNAPDE